jgi:anaerobic selenocysteine-containing dehydrogenase
MDKNEKKWTWEEDGMKVVRSVARTGPGCHYGCGVLLYVKDDKLIKVEGDPEFPINKGSLCPRCTALTEVVYHPDRLKYPLKRIGERGEDKWERITWEEAFDNIADKFNEIRSKYGPESVFFCQGTARDVGVYQNNLAYSFGSPNTLAFGPLHGHACHVPRVITTKITTGVYEFPDYSQFFPNTHENANWRMPKCIMIWGNEPTASTSPGSMGYLLMECIKRGAELIVIDPRKTWVAARAKMWLQIRPGTDAALALGMLNVIINEKLYDEEFVRDWTYGFDELKKRVQEYPPEKASKITWIPEEQIIAAARMYAASEPAAIQWGVAVDQTKECIPTIHAIISLWSMTGNMDAPGGNVIGSGLFGLGQHGGSQYDNLNEERKRNKIGAGMYPLFNYGYRMPPGAQLTEQLLSEKPYPLKAAWIQSTNTFACGAADSRRVYEGFKKLGFVVVVDLFMTPTAMAFADIILPAATYPERDGIGLVSSICVGTTNKAIKPVGEVKSDMEINFELGKRLNPGAWPWKDVREMFNSMLEPTGMTFEELRDKGYLYDKFQYKKYEKGLLRTDGKPGFATPTGKVELYSTILEKCNLDPLPYFEEPPESPVSTPELAEEYPFILTTGAKTPVFFHSEHRQIPSLRRINPEPITEIHPDAAAKLCIKEGDWIYIENRYGRCRQKARLTERIDPRVVHSQHGWWFPEKSGPEPSLFGVWESNINLLLPAGMVGKSGFGYPFKAQICRVYPVEEA